MTGVINELDWNYPHRGRGSDIGRGGIGADHSEGLSTAEAVNETAVPLDELFPGYWRGRCWTPAPCEQRFWIGERIILSEGDAGCAGQQQSSEQSECSGTSIHI